MSWSHGLGLQLGLGIRVGVGVGHPIYRERWWSKDPKQEHQTHLPSIILALYFVTIKITVFCNYRKKLLCFREWKLALVLCGCGYGRPPLLLPPQDTRPTQRRVENRVLPLCPIIAPQYELLRLWECRLLTRPHHPPWE
jgi:hypothetical protein